MYSEARLLYLVVIIITMAADESARMDEPLPAVYWKPSSTSMHMFRVETGDTAGMLIVK